VAIEITGLPSLDWSHQTEQLVHDLIKKMKIPRRHFLCLLAGTTAFPAVLRIAVAETYPVRPIRLIVTFLAGGAADLYARLIGQWLTEQFGHVVIIENRPGAGGNIGTEAVVNAAPDGYTLLLVGVTNTWNTTLYPNLNFDFIRDIVPVALLRALGVTSLTRLEVLPDVPAVAEVVSGYEATGWTGIGAPRNTPTEIINKLNKEINACLADPELITSWGSQPSPISPIEFTKYIADETEKWAKVITFSGAKVY
jgi:tripartite-type tricarboxylate transporter receptor subunit TctC